jgi:hypothetical protein
MEVALFVAASDRPVDLAHTAASQSSPAPDPRHQPDRSGVPALLPQELSGFDLLEAAHRRRTEALAELARCLPGRVARRDRVVQALETSRTETNGLISSSQSAVGILQASQAGNQLIALRRRPADGHDHPA